MRDMSGRNYIIQCGIVVLAFGLLSFSSSPQKESVNQNNLEEVYQNDTVNKKKKQGKKDTSPNTRSTSVDTLVNQDNGVMITTSSSLENLAEDEVYIPPVQVRREYVLEEDFKLWRIFVQKGRKTLEYWKVEVPYGTFFRKNEMDITEEFFNYETKDLPEGEVKRYMRDEFEQKERERIRKEIYEQFQIRSIPMDSLYYSNPDSINQNSPENTGGNR